MEFTSLVEELRGTTGQKEKARILRRYMQSDFIQYLLRETYDPKRLHNVVLTKKDLPDPKPKKNTLEQRQEVVKSMFETLANCQSAEQNRKTVRCVMEELWLEDQEALMAVVNKNLRCGVSIKSINKIAPIIDVMPIQLANKFNPSKRYQSQDRFAYVSKKLDGQRILSMRDRENGWELFTRGGDFLGNRVNTLQHWIPELEKLYELSGVDFVDGEAYLHGMRFEEIQSLVGSDVNIKDTSSLEYHIFYIGKWENPEIRHKGALLDVLPDQIEGLLSSGGFKKLVGVKQERIIFTTENIYDCLNNAVAEGYEGVVIRSSKKCYDFQRSDYLLKVKKSDLSGTEKQADVMVCDLEYGDVVIREAGVEEVEELPTALHVIQEDGTECKVGSGFTVEVRRAWKNDPYLVINKMIEVEFQGYGSNGRMRFPRYLRTRDDL